MNIFLVDDHALFREGLRHLFRDLDASVRVTEAAGARQALELLRARDDLDLVLLDLALPDARPFEVLEASRRLQPQVPVVVVSASQDRFEIERAMALGAQAYVFKSSSSATMLAAVRRVLKGEIVAPDIAGEPAAAREAPLTERQIEVLRLLARGLSNKEIGDQLGLAENTIKIHLGHIYRTLGVTSRTAALHKATQLGLVVHAP
jgi:DNA-binding NarL/FixJ family response regulator